MSCPLSLRITTIVAPQVKRSQWPPRRHSPSHPYALRRLSTHPQQLRHLFFVSMPPRSLSFPYSLAVPISMQHAPAPAPFNTLSAPPHVRPCAAPRHLPCYHASPRPMPRPDLRPTLPCVPTHPLSSFIIPPFIEFQLILSIFSRLFSSSQRRSTRCLPAPYMRSRCSDSIFLSPVHTRLPMTVILPLSPAILTPLSTHQLPQHIVQCSPLHYPTHISFAFTAIALVKNDIDASPVSIRLISLSVVPATLVIATPRVDSAR